MAATGGTQIVNAFQLSSKRFLDLRQHCSTVEELKATSENSIPDGYTRYVEETRSWYTWDSHNTETDETGKWRKSVPIHEALTEEYIYAIVDEDETLLFGIRFDGEVVYSKGMSDEVRFRLKELEGYQLMHDEEFLWAIVDRAGRILFGIEYDGQIYMPKGVVQALTWEEYSKKQWHKDILYIILGKNGVTEGAYYNGRAVSADEAQDYFRDENLLSYRGGMMTRFPKVWIDYDNMQVMVEYPSDYSGPMFVVDDGMLFLV